jgi:hypothetical protein
VHFRGDVTHGADVSQRVQRHGNVEVVFQLSHQFQHLQRVEAQIGKQFARAGRLDRPPADSLQNFDDVAFDGLGRR